MKKYDELTARLLERRDQYVAAQAAKRKRLMRVALPVGGGLLAALVSVGLWQGGAFENTPPVTDEIQPDTSATTATDGTTTEGADTTVTTVTTTDVTPSNTVTGDSTQGSVTDPEPTDKTEQPATDKTESTGGKTTATKTEQPTTGKSDPTTGKTKPTTGTTTKPTTVKPTAPTGTTVKPNNPEVTDPTTKPTTQSSWNGGEFNWDGDTIVVGVTEFNDLASCPSGPMVLSVKLPALLSETEEYLPIALSYGFLGEIEFTDDSIIAVTMKMDYAKEQILKNFTADEVSSSEYAVEQVSNGKKVQLVFGHTEIIYVPLLSLSKDSGEILIQMKSYMSNVGMYGSEYRRIYYARSRSGIVFSHKQVSLPY